MNELILKQLKQLTLKALKKDEVPVACIIVKDSKIISKAYNQKISKKDPTAHAEVIAIKKACKKIHSWNLKDCKLYVTLKPCNMCLTIIKEARITNVEYLVDNNKIVNNKMIITKSNNQEYEEYFSNIISKFFRNKR